MFIEENIHPGIQASSHSPIQQSTNPVQRKFKKDHLLRECRDDLAEGGQALVDVGALLQAFALSPGRFCSLRSGQVHQGDLAHLESKKRYYDSELGLARGLDAPDNIFSSQYSCIGSLAKTLIRLSILLRRAQTQQL